MLSFSIYARPSYVQFCCSIFHFPYSLVFVACSLFTLLSNHVFSSFSRPSGYPTLASSILHRLLEQPPKLLPFSLYIAHFKTRRQHQYTRLWNGALDELVDMLFPKP